MIDLSLAKDHLRVIHDDEDALIQEYIATAVEDCEENTWRTLQKRERTYTLDTWPKRVFQLPHPPLVQVISITCVDHDGNIHVLPETDYIVDTKNEPGRVYVKTWPNITLREIDGITVTYEAGYDTLPKPLQQAILLRIGHYYENREAVVGTAGIGQLAEIPMAVKALESKYRIFGWSK